MSDEFTAVLVCSRWKDRAVPSVRGECVACRRHLAISLVSLPKVKEIGAETRCFRCAQKVMTAEDVAPEVTPEVLAEVERLGISPEAAKSARDAFRNASRRPAAHQRPRPASHLRPR